MKRKLLAFTLLVSCFAGAQIIRGAGGARISGTFTANCIPKAVTAVTLNCSSITDNGTNVTTTEGIIGVAGTASVPTYAYTGGASYGTTFIAGQGEIGISINGNYRYGILNSEFRIGASSILTFSSANDPTSTAADSFFGRRGAANFRLGATDVNGSPVAQTLSVQNAITGSGLAGAAFIFNSSLGTGLGTPAPWDIKSAAVGPTGSTTVAQLQVGRFGVNHFKTLTSGAATTIISTPLAADQGEAGKIYYAVIAHDTTNHNNCVNEGIVSYSGENSAGVFKSSLDTPLDTSTNCTGATTLTLTFATTQANPDLVQVTPTLSFSGTVTQFYIVYSVMNFAETDPTY